MWSYLNLVCLAYKLNEAIISVPDALILATGPEFAKAIKNWLICMRTVKAKQPLPMY